MNEYDALIESCRACASGFNTNCDRCMFCRKDDLGKFCYERLHEAAANAIEELSKPKWIPVTERLPECELGAEVGNIEWISCGMVFAGCFGRGGRYRDAYFRTWTDGTEGIDAKDADYWRPIQIPEPPKGE